MSLSTGNKKKFKKKKIGFVLLFSYYQKIFKKNEKLKRRDFKGDNFLYLNVIYTVIFCI